MKLIETDSITTVEGYVTHVIEFEHNGIYGTYTEVVDEGIAGIAVSAEIHYNGIDGYLKAGDWNISRELDYSLKESLNKSFNAGFQL